MVSHGGAGQHLCSLIYEQRYWFQRVGLLILFWSGLDTHDPLIWRNQSDHVLRHLELHKVLHCLLQYPSMKYCNQRIRIFSYPAIGETLSSCMIEHRNGRHKLPGASKLKSRYKYRKSLTTTWHPLLEDCALSRA